MEVFIAELHAHASVSPQLRKSAHRRKFGNHLTAHRPCDRPSAPQANQCLIFSTARTESLALVKEWTKWPYRWFWKFFERFAKSPLLPSTPHRSRFFWLNSPDIMKFSSWKLFIMWLFSNLLCKGTACLDRPEHWMNAICLPKLGKTARYFKVCMIRKQRLIVLFTSDVMYKKYKKLVYTPPDLLARFCKVNLSNTKNSASFIILASFLDWLPPRTILSF